LDLVYALCDAPDLTILVDATARGGEAGTVYTIEPNLNDLERPGEVFIDSHAMDPVRVLNVAKTMRGQLGRILLVGCEPADLGGEDGRIGLTEPVAAAVATAADIVESLIEKRTIGG
jgi:hydrogenase maturation protease